MVAMLTVGICAIIVTQATSMYDLILPHFGLGLGIGVVDSALMPLLASLVDVRHKVPVILVYVNTNLSMLFSLRRTTLMALCTP